MSDVDAPSTVQIIGPFRGDVYHLSVDGCRLFGVDLYGRHDTDKKWTVCLDGRFEIDVSEDEVKRWAWLMANAMAISAGYTHHGPNSRPANLHATRFGSMSSGETN